MSGCRNWFHRPVLAEPTVVVTFRDVIEPSTGQGYERDPRTFDCSPCRRIL
ncbi:hypothetical protein ABVN80_08370 [Acinetobacter baumannii]